MWKRPRPKPSSPSANFFIPLSWSSLPISSIKTITSAACTWSPFTSWPLGMELLTTSKSSVRGEWVYFFKFGDTNRSSSRSIQNPTSTILSRLMPVKTPSVPPAEGHVSQSLTTSEIFHQSLPPWLQMSFAVFGWFYCTAQCPSG